MTGKRDARGGGAADAVKRGAEATANGIHQVTNIVARNDDRVADGVQAVTHLVWQGLSATGQQASKVLHGSATRAADAVQDAINGSGQSGALPPSVPPSFANSRLPMFVTFPDV